MNTYGLPDNYTARLEPQYFHDELADAVHWQADVYRLAARLARKSGIRRLVDIGCGRAGKLMQLAGEFETVGIDFGANIEACQAQYPDRQWESVDLEAAFVNPWVFADAVAICADVIEHLPHPEQLVITLHHACSQAAFVLVSTPDRDRVRHGRDQLGPPSNVCHVREWTAAELVAWFKAEGLPVVWGGWTISNDTRPDQVHTSLVILSQGALSDKLPITFECLPAYRPHIPPKRDVLKVWMSPTPSEAARDNTNSIHQIVLRMAQHLPDYGVELIESRREADLAAGHAGQGSDEPIDVAHYHGLYPTGMTSEHGVWFAINSHVVRNLKTARRITAPSNWIADVLRRDMHVSPAVIPWGVDTDEWTPGEQPHVYALWNKARVDWVCDPSPMIQLAASVPNGLFLTTFGEGTPNIRTVGRQPYEIMKQYVRNAGLYLSTNVETFGVGVLEACASGVPVLGFRQGAIPDYIQHGVHGFLAEPGDMAGLVEGFHYCMKHRRTLGANARELAKQFTWERVAERFAAVYQDVIRSSSDVRAHRIDSASYAAGRKPTAPVVTVVIPCHNYQQYVVEAIRSVQVQSLNNFECFVINDSSSDQSEAVVREAIAGDARFQVFNVQFGNLSATRNFGIEQGDAPFLCCLDADDRMGHPDYLETLVADLEQDCTQGIAFSGITVMNADGQLGHLNPWPKGYSFDRQAQRFNQVPSLCVFRREAWRRAGGFRPYFVYAQDAEFWTTVGAMGYTARQTVQEGWFHYRLHNQSQSQVHRNGSIPEPDWTEFHPWTHDGLRPLAADGVAPKGSWPVRFYHQPDVAVIIPVGKGHEQMVKDALHSLEGQTHRFWECVVVNDSGDDLGLENGFPWAREVRTEGVIGAGAARNVGAAHSHAPYLVFLDADDLLKPRFLELTLKAFRQHGRYAYTDWLSEEKQTHFEVHRTPEYSFQAVWERPSIHPITALIPRQWFQAVGGFDESMSAFEDVDFFMKMLTHGFCGVRVPEPLLIYHLHSGTRRAQGEKIKDSFRKLLTVRYGAFMEGKTMCNCVDPPKGKIPVPPTDENVAEYRDAYGEMVKVQLTWEDAPLGQVTFKGPATRVNYGRRARGDVFHVWEKDITMSEGVFTRLENYVVEASATEVPPPPVPVVTAQDIINESPTLDEPEVAEPVGEMATEPADTSAEAASEPEVPPPAPKGKKRR